MAGKSLFIWSSRATPRWSPGRSGRGGTCRFFRSTFLRVKDYEALWEMPNGRRKFFPRDRLAEESGGGVERFRSREGDWSAVWEEKRREVVATVTATDDPETWFHYDGGRLHSFRMGPESPEYRVDWLGGSHYLRAIRPANQRQGPVEILYGGAHPRGGTGGRSDVESRNGRGRLDGPRRAFGLFRVPGEFSGGPERSGGEGGALRL